LHTSSAFANPKAYAVKQIVVIVADIFYFGLLISRPTIQAVAHKMFRDRKLSFPLSKLKTRSMALITRARPHIHAGILKFDNIIFLLL
tara:strand:- start:480 stop:743 length:264 start_codon:yes stop_codon:yes gene_type:complete